MTFAFITLAFAWCCMGISMWFNVKAIRLNTRTREINRETIELSEEITRVCQEMYADKDEFPNG